MQKIENPNEQADHLLHEKPSMDTWALIIKWWLKCQIGFLRLINLFILPPKKWESGTQQMLKNIKVTEITGAGEKSPAGMVYCLYIYDKARPQTLCSNPGLVHVIMHKLIAKRVQLSGNLHNSLSEEMRKLTQCYLEKYYCINLYVIKTALT